MTVHRVHGVAALALGLCFASSTAQADVSDWLALDNEWESPRAGSVTASGGLYYTEDATLQSVYGSDGVRQLRLGLSYAPISLLQLDGGVEFLREQGALVGEDSGETSAELAFFDLMILHAGATLRLDIFREQPIVPYVSAGASWGVFKISDDSNAVVGDKGGYYQAAGLEFLLDRLEPTRAADLDISQGINDTYIFLEWRRQVLKDVGLEDQQLDFSGTVLSVGLKLDF